MLALISDTRSRGCGDASTQSRFDRFTTARQQFAAHAALTLPDFSNSHIVYQALKIGVFFNLRPAQ
jgi:hypothetical protein